MLTDLSFVCVGPAKTGTSWLDTVLRCHSEVQLPSPMKETFFFDSHFQKGVDWYGRCFGSKEGVVRGEVAPSYFLSNEARERINASVSEAKIIIILREPVSRAQSHHQHHYRKGRVSTDFDRAVEAYPEIIEASRYAKWVPLWESLFGEQSMLLLLYDDIERQPETVWSRICEFLEIQAIPLPEIGKSVIYKGGTPRFRALAAFMTKTARGLHSLGFHKLVHWGRRSSLQWLMRGGKSFRALSAEEVRELKAFYQPDVAWVERRLGRQLPAWH
jgi:hypothetical protein